MHPDQNEREQNDPENIPDLVAACFRPLDEAERRYADLFFDTEFQDCSHAGEVLLATKDPGIAADAGLTFFFRVVQTYHMRLHPNW